LRKVDTNTLQLGKQLVNGLNEFGMAERTRIDIDAVINTGDSLQKLRALRKAQKEVVAGSAEFNQLAAAIRDTEDS
jgi:hypothetical protein